MMFLIKGIINFSILSITYGSHRDRNPKTPLTDLLVYYEVSEGKRETVKQKFYRNFIIILFIPKIINNKRLFYIFIIRVYVFISEHIVT